MATPRLGHAPLRRVLGYLDTATVGLLLACPPDARSTVERRLLGGGRSADVRRLAQMRLDLVVGPARLRLDDISDLVCWAPLHLLRGPLRVPLVAGQPEEPLRSLRFSLAVRCATKTGRRLLLCLMFLEALIHDVLEPSLAAAAATAAGTAAAVAGSHDWTAARASLTRLLAVAPVEVVQLPVAPRRQYAQYGLVLDAAFRRPHATRRTPGVLPRAR